MPELPDVVVVVERLASRVGGKVLERVRVASPFVLRTWEPPLDDAHGRTVVGVRRLGKRIVLELSGDRFLSIHLMVAGRLRWKEAGVVIPRKLGMAALDFAHGSLLLTEAASKKRAALHYLASAEGLKLLDRGGIEPLEATAAAFRAALRRENRTLKRALTDPRLVSGIGNAYSDEILHRAGLSPLHRTDRLDDVALDRLHDATRAVLAEWIERTRREVGDGFPEKMTAFRPEMAVHGKYGEPCPVCSTRVQRIRHADNEINYCPRCQTGGKLLADRSLSRLLRGDWPRSIDELEENEAVRPPLPPKPRAKRRPRGGS